MWLGIKQKMISLFDDECSLQSSLIISGCSSFLLFNDNRTESEFENMMNFLFFFRDNVKSQVYCTGLSCENRTFHWKSFCFYYFV